VAAFGGIKPAERLNCAPPERQVENVAVLERPYVAPEIEIGAEENRVVEGATEMGVTRPQLGVACAVVTVKARRPQRKRSYGEILAWPASKRRGRRTIGEAGHAPDVLVFEQAVSNACVLLVVEPARGRLAFAIR
jgi:hypothetical protein